MGTEKEEFRFRIKGKALVAIDWANVYGWRKSLDWKLGCAELYNYLKTYPEVMDIKFYYGTEKGNEKSETFQTDMTNLGFNVITKDVKWTPVFLEKSHFKKLVKDLFDYLDSSKIKNSEISNKLYELAKKIEGLPKLSIKKEGGKEHDLAGSEQFKEIYELIEELDHALQDININIDFLQKELTKPVSRRKCDFDVEITRDVFNEMNNFETLILFSGDGDYSALVDDLISLKNKKAIVVFAKEHKGKEYEDFKKGLFLCPVNRLKEYIRVR